MTQLKLFEPPDTAVDIASVLLYALGDFQSRGKVLANRDLAFDRLRGAFLRSFAKFGLPELSDEQIVKTLRDLGATVTDVPNFVAKHPFRITVSGHVAENAALHYSNEKRR
ncbi:MAG: hypothetical protein ABIV48_11220 [Pyrinomonadaceae bacterium]